VSNSGTAANADLNYIFNNTITLTSPGSATLIVKAINDAVSGESLETLIVNLRTGSTTGPIVATAPTVTITDVAFQASPTYSTGRVTVPGTYDISNLIGTLDGKFFKFDLQHIGSAANSRSELLINGVVIGGIYVSSNGFITLYAKLPPGTLVQWKLREGAYLRSYLTVYKQV